MQMDDTPNRATPPDPNAHPSPRLDQQLAKDAPASSKSSFSTAGAPARATEPVCTGEQQTVVERFAERINASWHKSAKSILELANDCAAADKELNASAKRDLIARLKFDRTVFVKLVAIGNDARLPPLMPQLPPSFSTLYELTQFNQDKLTTGLKTGAINPRATRQELMTFRNSGEPKSGRKTPKLKRLKSLWKETSETDQQTFLKWTSNGCPDADSDAAEAQ